jgi:hypothetical protein
MAIEGLDKRDFCERFSMYPNMGSLCLTFLRNPLAETSFGKQQDLEPHEFSAHFGKLLSLATPFF